MKVGIVTWHHNPNYGGILQAYALQEVVKSFGYEVEFINYRPELRGIKSKTIRMIKDLYISFFHSKLYKGRKLQYKFIDENLDVGETFFVYEDLCSVADDLYDVGICGSDQIWSNNQGFVDPYYYLDFLSEHKRISYAPSIGYNRIDKKLEKDFIKKVKEIRFLSIREEKGADIIEDLAGLKAEVVLDPTFLFRKNDWLTKLENIKDIIPKEDYLLLYLLGNNRNKINYAKKLSEILGVRLIAIETKDTDLSGVNTVYGDPLDFVNLINNAKYVLTDSFHGLALSINLEKEFGVFKRFDDEEKISQNSRIYNILNKFNLHHRLVEENDDPGTFLEQSVDYSYVNSILEDERKKSLFFLSEAIKKIGQENK